MWDLFIVVLLITVCLIIPLRLAFANNDSTSWLMFYIITDLLFLTDIILTFFSAVSDEKLVYEITNKKLIAQKYLKGWFWIDFISILPLDLLM